MECVLTVVKGHIIILLFFDPARACAGRGKEIGRGVHIIITLRAHAQHARGKEIGRVVYIIISAYNLICKNPIFQNALSEAQEGFSLVASNIPWQLQKYGQCKSC